MSAPLTHSSDPGSGAWTTCNRLVVANVVISDPPTCSRCKSIRAARRTVALGRLARLEAARSNGHPGPAIEREIEALRRRVDGAR